MKFSELVSGTWEFGLRKAGTLVVIPFYRNYDALFLHLGLLARQTVQDFDAIIVLNALSDEKKVLEFLKKRKFGYGIVAAKRKEDTGSTGGFFAGEKYALENGYSLVILADDDCLPDDADLVAALRKAAEGCDAASPKVRLTGGGKDVMEGGSLHMYSFVTARLLGRTGLHFVPLYIGADDGEFSMRVLDEVNPIPRVDAWASHPYAHTVFVDFPRSILYRVNHALFVGTSRDPGSYLENFALLAPAYLVFGSPAARKGALHLLSSVLTFTYGKNALPQGMEPGRLRTETGFKEVLATADRLGKAEMAARLLRKEVLLKPVPNSTVLLSMLLARETWIWTGKGCYLIGANGNPALHILKLAAFAFLVPLFLLAGIASLPLNMLRKPRTLGYGLEP